MRRARRRRGSGGAFGAAGAAASSEAGDRVGVERRREAQRKADGDVEQPLSSMSAISRVFARRDHERLEVGALDAGAQDVVARRAAAGLELLDLRDARVGEGQVLLLDLDELRSEHRLEIGALHRDRDRAPRLLDPELGRLADAPRGARGIHDPAALEERLRQVEVEL